MTIAVDLARESMPVKEAETPIGSAVVAEKSNESKSKKVLLLQFASSGSKDKDIRRLKRIHGFLTSTPGNDRFAIICKENGKSYRLEFPNNNTYINDSLLRELKGIVGESNVMVEE